MLVTAESDGKSDVANTALDAILYGLIVIGEAVKSLSITVQNNHPEIP